MPIEIEKKYRITQHQRDAVEQRLLRTGAELRGEGFEENTLYSGKGLEGGKSILRLRRVGTRAILTFKENLPESSSIKHRRENETAVHDPDEMNAILEALGLVPALIYEKRRVTWVLGNAEIMIDQLPFGLFMEIEGPEAEILQIEHQLGVNDLRTENATYPQLTVKHGTARDKVIEARFSHSL